MLLKTNQTKLLSKYFFAKATLVEVIRLQPKALTVSSKVRTTQLSINRETYAALFDFDIAKAVIEQDLKTQNFQIIRKYSMKIENRKPTDTSTFAISGISISAYSFVVTGSSALRINLNA